MTENQDVLKEGLLALAQIMKSQTEVYESLAIELVAVKNALRALSPSFEDILIKERLQAQQSISQSVVGLIDRLDLLIRKLKPQENR